MIFGLLVSIALFYSLSGDKALSFLIGSFLICINIALLHWMGPLLLNKKKVALLTAIIVSKVPILLLIIWWLSKFNWIALNFLGVGVGSIAFSTLIWGSWMHFRREL